MRINVYAEELPDDLNDSRAIERQEVTVDNGKTFRGVRLYLKSPEALHDTPDDDDRSAITIWGPRDKVAAMLRKMADTMEHNQRG